MRRSALLVLLAAGGVVVPLRTAEAGGIGLLATGGLHQEIVYYYDASDAQWQSAQQRPNTGGGLELVLGDRDDRIQGVARGYYLADAAPLPPENPSVPQPTYGDLGGTDHIGLGTVGIRWGIFKDPGTFQVNLATDIGAGFLTVSSATGEAQNLEFALGQAGGGATLRVGRNLQAWAEVTGTVRFRKSFAPGGNVYAGLRYLFD